MLVEALLDGRLEALVAPLLMGELARVLSRPKFARAASEGRAEAYVTLIAERGTRVADPAPCGASPTTPATIIS